MKDREIINLTYCKNMEKFFAHWTYIYKKNIENNLFFYEEEEKKLNEKLSFFSVYASFFILLFSNPIINYKECRVKINSYSIFIVLYVLGSFQNNWNHEILQNFDFFPKIVDSMFLKLKKNVDKRVLVNLIGSISNPLLYILSIDIKSAQNKILKINLEIGENEKFCSDFKENFMIKFFRNSMKTCLFLNFGKYLLLLFTKKKFFFFSSKTSFSKIFFFNFLLFKANKSFHKKKMLFLIGSRLIFCKITPKKQKYLLRNLIFLKRKIL